MSLYVDQPTGRIIFRSADGRATFDSSKRNLIVTNFVNTSFTIDAVNTLQSLDPVVKTQTKVLASNIHPLANTFMGTHTTGQITRSIGGTRLVFLGVETMHPDGGLANYRTYLTGPVVLANGIWYHFTLQSGRFSVVINYRHCAEAARSFPGQTVRVSAWFGTFDY